MEGEVKTVTVDIETTGLNPWRDKILLIAYRLNGIGEVKQIDLTKGEDDAEFRAIVANPKVVFRAHNAPFDALFLSVAGYEINGPLECTRVLAYLNWPDKPHGLKELASWLLKVPTVSMKEIGIGPKKKELPQYVDNSEFYQIEKKFYPTQPFKDYNKRDVELCDAVRKQCVSGDWFRNVEQPLTRLLFDTELRGIQLDVAKLRELKADYEERLEALQKELGEINPRSPRQVKEALKERGLSVTTTNKLTLKKAVWENGLEFAETMLKYRELHKLYSTYVKPLLEESDSNGRIHGLFNQAGSDDGSAGTSTGRLTSKDPNLQNISVRTEEGREIRKAFVPTEGHLMFDTDLRQIEPRLVAHYTQNPLLLNAYNSGLDTHAVMGGIIYGKKPEELSSIERFVGKTSWLASFYGCSAAKLKVISETYSDDPIPFDEAYFENVQAELERNNPQLYAWRRQHIESVKRCGYIKTFGGRIIKIDGLNHWNNYTRFEAERMCVNYLIQGSAADIMKMILVRFKFELQDKGLAHMLAVVHDEILGEYKPEDETVPDIIHDIMTTTVKLHNVPIDANTNLIGNWCEAK